MDGSHTKESIPLEPEGYRRSVYENTVHSASLLQNR